MNYIIEVTYQPNFKKTIKILLAFGLAGGSLWLAFNLGEAKISSMVKYQKDPSVIASEIITGKINNLKNGLLTVLSTNCETKGVKDPDGAIIFDSNNEASIGRFQFQRKTIIYYYQKFYGKTLTNAEAIAVAIDPIKSTELASKILFGEKGGHRNWFTCSNKLDLANKVELIKSI